MVVTPRVLRQTFPGHHPVQWRTASPLWDVLQSPANNPVFAQPALLRFTTDTFMDDFLTVATASPTRLWEWQVQKETWRKPAPIPPLRLAPGQPPTPLPTTARLPEEPTLQDEPLKLYQSVHQRYYLVVASLVCRIPGLPDKTLKSAQGETVSFVLRRLMQDSNGLREHAFVNGFWQSVTPGQEETLRAEELTFPMFPATYTHASQGYGRRMFSGLVPVSNREAFVNAGRQAAASTATASETVAERRDRLLTVLSMDIVAPWRNINQLGSQEDRNLLQSWADIEVSDRDDLLASVHLAQDKLQTTSWYVLLDLANYLREYLPPAWNWVENSPDAVAPVGTPGKALLDVLRTTTFKPETSENSDSLTVLQRKFQGVPINAPGGTTGRTSLARALRDAYAARQHLENATASYDYEEPAGWPATLFLLCGDGVRSLVEGTINNLEDINALGLVEPIRDAFSELPPGEDKRLPLVPSAPSLIDSLEESDYRNDQFLIRCVYQRPNCPPTVHPTVVSQPTQAFQLASYFDPDAPARPIRIAMPIDTSPGGLRKFAKNTMFVMSDSLACQVEKARDLTFGDLVLSVLPWPFHKNFDANAGNCASGTLNFGKICTLSIPIITICALILLIIIVSLLDLIFKWVPFLIFCLPLPGLKAKPNAPSGGGS
ncbi:MAG: hypothetical protein DCF32_21915 [Leptolyngbya sp.]|nr:MAG: hypothetical protein DCF32_21915 [Leptolyngbya sp.]